MKTISIICHKCGKESYKPKKEYNRQIRNGRKYFFCSLSCAQSYNKKTTKTISIDCPWCKNFFETTTHKRARKCCSNLCAHKYVRSLLDPETHKRSVQRPSHYPQDRKFICVICGNTFIHKIKYNKEVYKTCSKECFRKMVSQWTRNNPNCGGKLGYKHFPYKGVSMDSRWEVEIAKWMDEKRIKWDRSKKRHMFRWSDENGYTRKYFPDFYLPDLNVYLDPKNDYYLQRDLPKLKQVVDTYGITLFYGGLDSIKQRILSVLDPTRIHQS